MGGAATKAKASRPPSAAKPQWMIATVRAVPPAEFEAWLAKKKKELIEAKLTAGEETKKLQSQTGANQVLNP